MATVQVLATMQAIRDAVVTATGVASARVIFDQPGAPRPEAGSVFVTLNLVGSVPEGQGDELVLTDTPGELKHIGRRVLSVSVNAYGPLAHQAIIDLQAKLQFESIRDTLEAEGVTVREVGSLRDLGAALETGYEERGQIDLRFGTVGEITENLGWVERVQGTGTWQGSTSITTTIEVDT